MAVGPISTRLLSDRVIAPGDGSIEILELQSSGIMTFPSGVTKVNVIFVGGGGPGGEISGNGSYYGVGGGGAGGVLEVTNIAVVPSTPYAIVIGAGGTTGYNGNDTTGLGQTAYGGGGGGDDTGVPKPGQSGGSGGGGGGATGYTAGGNGTSGQGFVGGYGYAGGGGGGGGGANGGGTASQGLAGGAGGTGITITIGLSSWNVGGGGGGSSYEGGASSAGGGFGGGGGGGWAYYIGTEITIGYGSNGTDLTGGGGGGGSYFDQYGKGGSGRALIYYRRPLLPRKI